MPTHFVERLSDREMLTQKVTIVPVEVVVRNIVAGSLAKRLGLKEGDPSIRPSWSGITRTMRWEIRSIARRSSSAAECWRRRTMLREMRELGRKINAVLLPFFKERQMLLVDFKLEFGIFHNRLILADEISPDTCRFWDQTTKESMDKDRFRKDLGKIEEAYQEVLKRVCG